MHSNSCIHLSCTSRVFVSWYDMYVVREMRPNAPFPRRFTHTVTPDDDLIIENLSISLLIENHHHLNHHQRTQERNDLSSILARP